MPNVIGPFSVLTTSMAPLEGYMARLRHLTSPRIFARYEDGSVEVAISRYRRPMPTDAARKEHPEPARGSHHRASRWKPPATPHGRPPHEAPACAPARALRAGGCPHADRRRPLATHQPCAGDRTIRITQSHTRQYMAILIHLEPPVCHVLPS